MGLFARLFEKMDDHAPEPIAPPDDSMLTAEIERAKRENIDAAAALVIASKKQVRDADMIRQVLDGVLKNVEHRRKDDDR